MKKIFLSLLLLLILGINSSAYAHHCHSYYVTYRDYFQEEIAFHNCDKHYAIKETTVYYYSNGSRYTYVYNTIFNSDGTVLESGCKNVRHYIKDGKHYFTFYKNKKYNIMDENGRYLSVKSYKNMYEVESGKLLVKLDRKYGIIDLNEQVIVPIKYKSVEKVGENLFLTKLNGYYGFLDSSNKTLLKNEYDKIKPIYNVYKLKLDGDFGMANSKGEMILYPNCESIKKMGEYILVKRGKEYGVYDVDGNVVADIKYRKVKFERNTLYLQDFDKNWIKVE